jgi:hypothetical protein
MGPVYNKTSCVSETFFEPDLTWGWFFHGPCPFSSLAFVVGHLARKRSKGRDTFDPPFLTCTLFESAKLRHYKRPTLKVYGGRASFIAVLFISRVVSMQMLCFLTVERPGPPWASPPPKSWAERDEGRRRGEPLVLTRRVMAAATARATYQTGLRAPRTFRSVSSFTPGRDCVVVRHCTCKMEGRQPRSFSRPFTTYHAMCVRPSPCPSLLSVGGKKGSR